MAAFFRALPWPEQNLRGAAVRLHDVRGERSNVPRDSAVLYGAEDNVIKKDNTRKNDLKIENLGNLGLKILGILYLCAVILK